VGGVVLLRYGMSITLQDTLLVHDRALYDLEGGLMTVSKTGINAVNAVPIAAML
jgi:hypothetical protein